MINWQNGGQANKLVFKSQVARRLQRVERGVNVVLAYRKCPRAYVTVSTVQIAKGSDKLERFLSKVAFESRNLRKKPSRIEHVLIVKVYFERRKSRKFS